MDGNNSAEITTNISKTCPHKTEPSICAGNSPILIQGESRTCFVLGYVRTRVITHAITAKRSYGAGRLCRPRRQLSVWAYSSHTRIPPSIRLYHQVPPPTPPMVYVRIRRGVVRCQLCTPIRRNLELPFQSCQPKHRQPSDHKRHLPPWLLIPGPPSSRHP